MRAVFSLLVSSCTRDPPKLELAQRAFESKNIVNVFRHFQSDCFFANWRLIATEIAISYVFLAAFIGFKEQSKITYFIFNIIKKIVEAEDQKDEWRNMLQMEEDLTCF